MNKTFYLKWKSIIAVLLVVAALLFVASCGMADEKTEGPEAAGGSVDDTVTIDVNTNSAIATEGDKEDTKDKKETYVTTEGPIKINEIIASNTKFNKHKGDYYDMVELVNTSGKKVFLGDYYISDSKKHLKDYKLPRVYLEPKKKYIVYCVGKDVKLSKGDVAFALSAEGEKIYLVNKAGEVIDKLEYENLPANVSYGRSKTGKGYRYFSKPSFGKANGNGYIGVAEKPEVSVKDGFHSKAVKVKFTNNIKNGLEIYYTTDGSRPTGKSKKYKGETITMSRTGSIRAIAKKSKHISSEEETFCYFIGTHKYTLDTVMVSMNSNDYARIGASPNSRTKYAANITLYKKGKKAFTENCGISASGASSRMYEKRSYKVKFSTKYGNPKLKYKVFDDLDIDSFDALILRGGSQANADCFIKDEFVTSLARKDGVVTEVLSQACHPVNLYVNNQYKGVFYLREAVNSDFVASHVGGKKSDVTIIKQNYLQSGKDAAEWRNLYAYARNHDLSQKQHYEYIKKRVSLESFIDHTLIQIWSKNWDKDNVRVCKGGDGKWRMILFDLDLTFWDNGNSATGKFIAGYNPSAKNYYGLTYKLLANKEFKKLWNKRAKKLLGKNGILSDKSALAQVKKMTKEIDHDMKYNCDYWSKKRTAKMPYVTYSGWKQAVKRLQGRIKGRADRIYKQVKK